MIGFFPDPHDGPWYHASPHDMPDGTVLIPGGPGEATSQEFYDDGWGEDRGLLFEVGGGRASHVWLSPSLHDAAFWAMALSAPYIYEVEPDADDEPQPWNGTGSDGWVSRGGRIKRRVDRLLM